MDSIYEMGLDAWGGGDILENYLNGCRNSSKYQKGQWFVLEGEGGLMSSLLVHSFGDGHFGIGSIATVPRFRRSGQATFLIESIIQSLEGQNAKFIFLYSDIDPTFYERFGFRPLPDVAQEHAGTTCMVRGCKGNKIDFNGMKTPRYF